MRTGLRIGSLDRHSTWHPVYDKEMKSLIYGKFEALTKKYFPKTHYDLHVQIDVLPFDMNSRVTRVNVDVDLSVPSKKFRLLIRKSGVDLLETSKKGYQAFRDNLRRESQCRTRNHFRTHNRNTDRITRTHH